MNKDIPKSFGNQLCLSLSALILLWLCAMEYLSLIDAVALFVLMIFMNFGFYRGVVAAVFSFLGMILSWTMAIYGYNRLYYALELNLCNITPFLGQVLCFCILLLGTWILWYVCSKFFLKKRFKMKSNHAIWNKITGGIIGFLEGILFSYIVMAILISTGIFYRNFFLDVQANRSFFLPHFLKTQILQEIRNIEVIQLVQESNTIQRMRWITQRIQGLDEKLQERIAEFLIWLAQNPYQVERCLAHLEMKKFLEKFLLIPEAQVYWQSDPWLQKLKHQQYITIDDICELLKRDTTRAIANINAVQSLLQNLNFDKLKDAR